MRRRTDLTRSQLDRRRAAMDLAAEECLVFGYEPLIEGLVLPDPDDRHVLAAAIKTRAHLIVTENRRDFPADALEPFGVEARSPDDFLLLQFDLAPAVVCSVIKAQRAALERPPLSVDQFLESLTRAGVRPFAARLAEYEDLL